MAGQHASHIAVPFSLKWASATDSPVLMWFKVSYLKWRLCYSVLTDILTKRGHREQPLCNKAFLLWTSSIFSQFWFFFHHSGIHSKDQQPSFSHRLLLWLFSVWSAVCINSCYARPWVKPKSTPQGIPVYRFSSRQTAWSKISNWKWQGSQR